MMVQARVESLYIKPFFGLSETLSYVVNRFKAMLTVQLCESNLTSINPIDLAIKQSNHILYIIIIQLHLGIFLLAWIFM